MAIDAWLDDLRRLLAGRGLPPAYVERLAAELSDHFEDLKEENMSMEAEVCSQLGQPEQVADAAVTAYRRRSFLGRHPTAAFLVFGVTPVLSQVVLFAVAVLAAKGIAAVADQLGLLSDHGRYAPPSLLGVEIAQYAFSLLFVVIPTILAALLYFKLGRRLGLGTSWMAASCVVLATMAMLPCWCVRLGADMAGHPRVIGCLSFPVFDYGWSECWLNISQLIQLTAPLAIGWWLLHRRRHQERPQLAS
jgi:hypothetical protein